MMLEERSVLATHDARVTKHRTTKAAAQALADSDIPPDVPDDVAEEAAGLMRERQALKDARKLKDCEGPLKGIMMFLNSAYCGTKVSRGADVQPLSLAIIAGRSKQLRRWRLMTSKRTSPGRVSFLVPSRRFS
jgi:hypothetical protein